MLRMAHRIGLFKETMCAQHAADVADLMYDLAAYEAQCVSHCPVIIADNVAEYYAGHFTDGVSFDRDFPNSRPPFDCFFVEYLWPCEDGPIQVGMLCWDFSKEEAADNLAGFSATDELSSYLLSCTTVDRVLVASVWTACGVTGWRATFGAVRLVFALDSRGAILRYFCANYQRAEMDSRAVAGEFWALSHVGLLAINFMHCKNVSRVDATESHGPAAKWLRRKRAPRIEYKVLNIGPMQQTLRTEGGIETNGLKKALHICRGHFAHYSEDKPLFGKYTGQFWKPQHVRGAIEQGVVVKDYSVTP